MEITAAGKDRKVFVTYKKIRNIWLRVDSDGSLKISCSRYVSKKQIREFILSRERWIMKTEASQKVKNERCEAGENNEAMWMGKKYPCFVQAARRNSMVVEEDRIIFYLKEDTPEIRRQVFYNTGSDYLVSLIKEKRAPLDQDICMKNSRPLPRITVRYMTSRWGSCTPSKAHISISSRLIHFPEVCLDYVLLHEYAHMLVANHSKEFYSVVSKRMPDYRAAEAMLK